MLACLAIRLDDDDMYSRHPVHRTIVVVDIEGFGRPDRTDGDRLAARAGLYAALGRAFRRAGIEWAACHHEDRGDGALILVAPEVPKDLFVSSLLTELAHALTRHNDDHPAPQRIRLRMVLHAGEVSYDQHGVAATSVNVAFRLLEAEALKNALKESPGVLAVMVSSWLFDEVVRHNAKDFGSYRPVRVTVKETTAIGWIHLPDAPYPPATVRTPRRDGVPRQLPMGSARFTGRDAELATLTNALETEHGEPVLVIITGVAGIGKTALALHWLREVRQAFPDGVLFLDLHAFSPGGPLQPADALDQLLRGLGVQPDRIPPKPVDQAALFRSVVAGRSLALLLDDAESADQVRWLLPAGGRSLVVVTSRHRLAGLVAAGAVFLPIEPLDRSAGAQLLANLIGVERIRDERGQVERLAALCGGLPLAVCIAAARLIVHPQWTLRYFAATLTDCRTRLTRLSAGHDLSMQAVLNMSYHALPADAARLYRLLGRHPRAEFGLGVVAATIDMPIDDIGDLVETLLDASLLEEIGQDHFRMHSLVQLHAHGLEHAGESDNASRRVFEWYLRSANSADRLLRPGRRKLPYAFVACRAEACVFAEHRAALAWLEAEQRNLLAVARQATDNGRHGLAWQLCDAMWALRYRVHHTIVVAICELGVSAARSWRNAFAEARMIFRLGLSGMDAGDHERAQEHLELALEMRRSLGDERGVTNVAEGLGLLALAAGRPTEAVERLRRVLDENERHGDGRRIARALVNLGRGLLATGDVNGALASLEQARQRFARMEAEDTYNDAWLGILLSKAFRIEGRPDLAADHVRRSLSKTNKLGGVFGAAAAHEELGDLARAMGDMDSARTEYGQAAAAYRRLGLADHERMRTLLEELT
jgi:tetratricopeptide (TPR) repeat protein